MPSLLQTYVLFTTMAVAFSNFSFTDKVMHGSINSRSIHAIDSKLKNTPSLTHFSAGMQTENIFFKNLDGKIISLYSLKGKVVFINFWATWCLPCRIEMPSIQKLYSKFKGNEEVVFLLVDIDNQPIKSQKFMDKRKFNLPVYTPVSTLPPSFLSGGIPTTLVVNKYSQIVFKHEGMGDFTNKEFHEFLLNLAK